MENKIDVIRIVKITILVLLVLLVQRWHIWFTPAEYFTWALFVIAESVGTMHGNVWLGIAASVAGIGLSLLASMLLGGDSGLAHSGLVLGIGLSQSAVILGVFILRPVIKKLNAYRNGKADGNPVLLLGLVILCLVASFADRGSVMDLLIVIMTGIAAYFLGQINECFIPLVMGFIQGNSMVTNYQRIIMLFDSGVMILLKRPFCMILLILTVFMLVAGRLGKRPD